MRDGGDEAEPETWPSGETSALVPLVDGLFSTDDGSDGVNAVIGSPPDDRHGGEFDCLWCVEAGDRVVGANPWA